MTENKSITIQFNSDGERVDMIDSDSTETLWCIDNLHNAIEVEDKLYELITKATGAVRRTRITFPKIKALEVDDKPEIERVTLDSLYTSKFNIRGRGTVLVLSKEHPKIDVSIGDRVVFNERIYEVIDIEASSIREEIAIVAKTVDTNSKIGFIE